MPLTYYPKPQPRAVTPLRGSKREPRSPIGSLSATGSPPAMLLSSREGGQRSPSPLGRVSDNTALPPSARTGSLTVQCHSMTPVPQSQARWDY